MSNEYIQAADDANRLLAGFAAVQTVAAAFAKVGSLQQAEEEARAALEVLQAQALIAGEQRDAAKLEAESLTDRMATLQSDAQAQAFAVVTEAQDKADKLVVDAEESAQSTRAAANLYFTRADTEVKGLQELATSLRSQVSDLEAKLASVKAQAAALFGV